MKKYDIVRESLERSVEGETFGAHGNFWRAADLEEFKAKSVFGRKLIEVGDAANSNLIRALKGLGPFGQDLDNPPAGAIFRRMPAGRDPMPDDEIDFIAQWIDDGCPDEKFIPESSGMALEMASGDDVEQYNRFFRDFDNFFMFESSDETNGAINNYFGIGPSWPGFATSNSVAAWEELTGNDQSAAAISYLAGHQLRFVRSFFGTDINETRLGRAFWLFGTGRLPEDNLRPQAPKHQMDGATMWLFWLSCGDAAVRTESEAASWEKVLRAVGQGMVGDSLFRTDRGSGRLTVTRYSDADPDVENTVKAELQALSGSDLLDFLIGLAREAIGVSETQVADSSDTTQA